MEYLFKVFVLRIIFVLPILVQSIIEGGADYLIEHYLEVIIQPNTSKESGGDSVKLLRRVDAILESTK